MTASARLQRTLGRKKRLIIGLMSGMSMDGIDLALAECSGDYPDFKADLKETSYRAYSPELKARLISGRCSDAGEVAQLNMIVAAEFAACVNEFVSDRRLSAAAIDAIGSHGQTIFHATSPGDKPPSSLQLGAPSLIAELTGIPTVGNFRLRDIAAGGQGAPLVAFSDHVLHRGEARPLGLLNLGSIANITVLTERFDDITAFDLGPANMPIDYFVGRGGQPGIDENGAVSARGRVIEPLLEVWLRLPFFQRPPPKAAGYGEFGPDMLAASSRPYAASPVEDLVRTAVEFSAQAVARGFNQFVRPRHPSLRRLKISGGGVYNKTLIERIGSLLPDLLLSPLQGSYGDAKEALAFAILAHATLSGVPGNIPGATGARKAVVLGEIAI